MSSKITEIVMDGLVNAKQEGDRISRDSVKKAQIFIKELDEKFIDLLKSQGFHNKARLTKKELDELLGMIKKFEDEAIISIKKLNLSKRELRLLYGNLIMYTKIIYEKYKERGEIFERYILHINRLENPESFRELFKKLILKLTTNIENNNNKINIKHV